MQKIIPTTGFKSTRSYGQSLSPPSPIVYQLMMALERQLGIKRGGLQFNFGRRAGQQRGKMKLQILLLLVAGLARDTLEDKHEVLRDDEDFEDEEVGQELSCHSIHCFQDEIPEEDPRLHTISYPKVLMISKNISCA